MNGATAEPCASTSRPPSTTLMTMIGSSQYLRRAPRNFHICTTRSIACLLEHVPVAVVRRARRIAFDPVARRGGVPLAAHRVAAEQAHHHPEGGEHAEENHPQHDGADDAAHQL